MVRTRSQSVYIERQNANDVLGAIREKARELADNRLINPPKSPSKQSASKEKRKSKRNSLKFERLLSSIKENLSKASDRILPDPPMQHQSIFDQIHEPIKSGEAKKKLKPVIIVIDD